MMEIQPEGARTLAAIIESGTFDAAARRLSVTPSAISQRIKALEVAIGRPVLLRGRPITLTPSGEAVVRFARELELMSAELDRDLRGADSPLSLPRVTVVVNGDSLHTWALRPLVAAGSVARVEILREDQEHSLDLLRNGRAAAAVTETSTPVPGCTSRRLGAMRYRPVCSPEFWQQWSAGTSGTLQLAEAPMVVYDDKDDLQDRYLRRVRRRPFDPPRHFVPGTHEFGHAIRLGLGWGMLPEQQIGSDIADGVLVPADPAAFVDLWLHWQQWKLSSVALDQLAERVMESARANLRTTRRPQRPSGQKASR